MPRSPGAPASLTRRARSRPCHRDPRETRWTSSTAIAKDQRSVFAARCATLISWQIISRTAACGLSQSIPGQSSAPRSTSLEQLGRGEIDILFAVDMFNEGVDVPEIGTVMMLRPTESAIMWLQQLGRGLRHVEGKLLQVIDYIGNHRIFLTKVATLLPAGPGDRSISTKSGRASAGDCQDRRRAAYTYSLRGHPHTAQSLPPEGMRGELEAFTVDFRVRNGSARRLSKFPGWALTPRIGHGGWFDFIRDMGDLLAERPFATHGRLLRELERPKVITHRPRS